MDMTAHSGLGQHIIWHLKQVPTDNFFHLPLKYSLQYYVQNFV